jgi:hypothetical protein
LSLKEYLLGLCELMLMRLLAVLDARAQRLHLMLMRDEQL